MADNVSDHEENACEMESSVQVPMNQENENNLLFNQNQSSDKTHLSEEQISQLLQEKLQLEQRGKVLKRLTTDSQQEHRILTAERQRQEIAFMSSNRNATSIAREIRNRLLLVYPSGKHNECAFQAFLDYSRKRVQNANMLNLDNKAAFQRKFTLLESAFSLFKEQLTTVETLLEPDYDILCQENGERFTDVMTECIKLEDSIYNIISMILEED